MDDLCTAEMAPGLSCHREAGHPGPHMIEGEVPESIGRMLAALADDAEHERERAHKEWKRYRVLNVVWIGLILFYLGLSIGKVLT